jgi:hypothetical protein
VVRNSYVINAFDNDSLCSYSMVLTWWLRLGIYKRFAFGMLRFFLVFLYVFLIFLIIVVE